MPNARDDGADIAALRKELDSTRAKLERQAAELSDLRSLVHMERARYRELFEVTPEGSLITDLYGAIREMNQSATTLLNASSSYLSGKPVANYIAEQERREFRIRLYRARTGAGNQEFLVSLVRHGLDPLPVSISLFPIADEKGGIVALGFRLRDVSESRAALVASREPAALIRAALDALSAQVVVLDHDGGIVTVNRAWADAQAPAGLFPPNIASGGNYLALCDDAIAHGQPGAAAVRKAVTTVLDGQRRRADVVFASAATLEGKDEAWYSLRATRCDGPEPVSVVVTHEDVTAEHRELARERALMQERAARTAAEAASQAKSEFLTTLSHELRTPLNAIAGYAQLIEMGVRGPVTLQQAEDLRRILRSERHLLGLINELLNFSRLERGEVSVDISPISLTEIVSEVIELIEPQAHARSLELTVRAPTELIALADPEKLRQILINLLSNALKFTREGGAIRIECDGNDLHTFVRVHDTGIGIPAPRLTEIFDPFVQVHRGYAGTTDGIGLGLAISRNLARAMHGDLTAMSELGEGSMFELRLPRAAPRADLT